MIEVKNQVRSQPVIEKRASFANGATSETECCCGT